MLRTYDLLESLVESIFACSIKNANGCILTILSEILIQHIDTKKMHIDSFYVDLPVSENLQLPVQFD